MRHRVTVIGVIVTALSTLAFAQRGLPVVVSLEIHSRAPGYSGRAEQAPVKSSYGHMPVFFQGSAPRIVVRIRNYTSRRVALGRAGRSWSDDLDLTIAHTSRRSSEGRVLVRRAARKTALEAGGDDDFLSFELISTSTGQLPPGRYRVDVALDTIALPTGVRTLPGNRLTAQEQFDVRPIDSDGALWDLYLYRAMRARNEKDLPAARMWAEAVLRMHPNSLAATWDIANAWLAEDNCTNALPYLERADRIMRTNADTLSHERNYYELTPVAAALLKRCSQRSPSSR